MLFGSTKLPEEKWLSLDDVVHFHAFGEPYVNGIREAGYPSARAFSAEINEVSQRCLAEAGSAPKHSGLVELLNNGSMSIGLGSSTAPYGASEAMAREWAGDCLEVPILLG